MELAAGQMVTRTEISDALFEGFSIKLGERMVRHALERLGIEPAERRPRHGEPGGPVALFEPLCLLTIASVYHRRRDSFKQRPESAPDLIRPFREAVRRAAASVPEARDVPGFVEDETFAAQLLLIGSPSLGMDPVHRRGHIQRRQWLLSWCSRGSAFMTAALQAWDAAYLDLLEATELDRHPLQPRDQLDRASATFVSNLGKTLRDSQSQVHEVDFPSKGDELLAAEDRAGYGSDQIRQPAGRHRRSSVTEEAK